MRPPKLMWLCTLIDLWRIILLSTAVLVIVIVFATTVRHTAEGTLGPLETLKFMGYIILPMLQYALPFAAGFGATLAFHRLTQDNELTAAAASGISHRAILAPAMFTGVVMAATLWYLSGQVIPRFLRSAEQMVALDLSKVLVSAVKAGQPIEFEGKVIHAKSVYQISPPPEGASQQLVLSDLSALELDEQGHVVTENFSRRAWLTIYQTTLNTSDDPVDRPDRSVTVIRLDLEGGTRFADGSSTSLGGAGWIKPVAGAFREEPKFLTSSELAELPSHPDRYTDINHFRRGLALQVVQQEWIQEINRSLRKNKRFRLTDGEGREYTIYSAGLDPAGERWSLRPAAPGKDVEVERASLALPGKAAEPATRFSSPTAWIRAESDRDVLGSVFLTLSMQNVAGQAVDRDATGTGSSATGMASERTIAGLSVPDRPQSDVSGLPSGKLLKLIDERGLSDDPAIGPVAKDLQRRIDDLGLHVWSKQHERAANVVACFVMVVTGAVTALRLGAALPLTVYLWSFFPAVAAIITISAGQQAVRGIGFPGLIVLWGGVALLALYAFGAYRLASRN